jgi:hypothetical protein
LKGCSKEQPFFMLRNWVEGEGSDDGFKLKGCSKEQPLWYLIRNELAIHQFAKECSLSKVLDGKED